jgi:thiol-disulfide isomerase/thioredoxin
VRAVAAIVIAVLIGLVVFIAVQFSDVGGRGVKVGVPRAAACKEASPTCLPDLTMIDTAGDAWTRGVLLGKVVVINFWATWCKPCIEEMPDLGAMRDRHRDEVVLIGVLNEEVSDETVNAFAKRHKLTWPIVRGDEQLMKAFGWPELLPTTFIYDRSGHVRFVEQRRLYGAQLEEMLGEVLRE